MAGLKQDTPSPTNITAHQQSRVLEVGFSDGAEFRIPFELMRVYSPSAEVMGHGPGQEVLQTGKREVGLDGLEAGGQLRRAADLLRRAQHGNLFLGLSLPPRLAASRAVAEI